MKFLIIFFIAWPIFAQFQNEYTSDSNTMLLLHLNEISGNIAYDASSFGNNGTINGNSVSEGKFSAGRQFTTNTADLGILLPNPSSLNITGPVTVETWLKANAYEMSGAGIFVHDEYQLFLGSFGGSGHLQFFKHIGNQWFIYQSNVQIPLNEWVHLAGIWDGTDAKLFINGNEVDFTLFQNNYTPLGISLIASHYNSAISPSTSILVDEIRISNIERTFNSNQLVEEFFDDFSYIEITDAESSFWSITDGISGPPEGALYTKEFISFKADKDIAGNKIMRLKCSTRNALSTMKCSRIQTKLVKFKEGTYAARIKFNDGETYLKEGNVQAFYTINNLTGNPLYSELDFEYLPYDVWEGENHFTKLYTTSWGYYNNENDFAKALDRHVGSLVNQWHIFIIDASDGEFVKYYLDNEMISIQNLSTVDTNGISIYPDERMQIAFSNWISLTQPLSDDKFNRRYEFEVDWVYHIKNQSLSYQEIIDKVQEIRLSGVALFDHVLTEPLILAKTTHYSYNEIETNLPLDFELKQNYPNPFNPTTTIKYQISQPSFVALKVYDILGNEVATLVNEEKFVGSYEVEFNSAGLSSGIYFYQLQASSFTQTKKMILLK